MLSLSVNKAIIGMYSFAGIAHTAMAAGASQIYSSVFSIRQQDQDNSQIPTSSKFIGLTSLIVITATITCLVARFISARHAAAAKHGQSDQKLGLADDEKHGQSDQKLGLADDEKHGQSDQKLGLADDEKHGQSDQKLGLLNDEKHGQSDQKLGLADDEKHGQSDQKLGLLNDEKHGQSDQKLGLADDEKHGQSDQKLGLPDDEVKDLMPSTINKPKHETMPLTPDEIEENIQKAFNRFEEHVKGLSQEDLEEKLEILQLNINKQRALPIKDQNHQFVFFQSQMICTVESRLKTLKDEKKIENSNKVLENWFDMAYGNA